MTEKKDKAWSWIAEDGRYTLRCKKCDQLVSTLLTGYRNDAEITFEDEKPLIPVGFVILSNRLLEDGNLFGTKPEEFIVNRCDLLNTLDIGKRIGCCGPDGSGGPHLSCQNGHAIGTEVGDCWTPQFVHLPKSAVKLCNQD